MSSSEFSVLAVAAAGMEAQRAALDVAARNVAAAEATDGRFERLVPRFSVTPDESESFAGDDALPFAEDGEIEEGPATPGTVRFLGTANEPGVEPNAIAEMVAVLNAQRAYEANATVFDLGKRLAERTIDVGRP
ncbi:MAG: hypothetical protein GIW95_09430 [Candidatus Eremiobacteraeota bacterium]|nr:hypothetical protein [Candidatus Eremiobacteraeota bacterium]